MLPSLAVLNFYSSVFADQLRRGRKTATIRLRDSRTSTQERLRAGHDRIPTFSEGEDLQRRDSDQVEVKRVRDLSPRDIEHDNPEFRRIDEMVHFSSRSTAARSTSDDTVTVVPFSQIIENPPKSAIGCMGWAGPELGRCPQDVWHS